MNATELSKYIYLETWFFTDRIFQSKVNSRLECQKDKHFKTQPGPVATKMQLQVDHQMNGSRIWSPCTKGPSSVIGCKGSLLWTSSAKVDRFGNKMQRPGIPFGHQAQRVRSDKLTASVAQLVERWSRDRGFDSQPELGLGVAFFPTGPGISCISFWHSKLPYFRIYLLTTSALKAKYYLIAFDEGERILIMSFFEISPWVLRGGPACIDVMPFDFRVSLKSNALH